MFNSGTNFVTFVLFPALMGTLQGPVNTKLLCQLCQQFINPECQQLPDTPPSFLSPHPLLLPACYAWLLWQYATNHLDRWPQESLSPSLLSLKLGVLLEPSCSTPELPLPFKDSHLHGVWLLNSTINLTSFAFWLSGIPHNFRSMKGNTCNFIDV